MSQEILLTMRGIDKYFPGVKALSNVDFTLRSHQIHALMGENGAGKSTLIKVLTGVYPKDGGTIQMNDKAISPTSPRDAERYHISTVYQEVNLIPHLTVAENICLGREDRSFGLIRWRQVRDRARQALARLDLKIAIDVDKQLSDCSIAIQQMVAIARALDGAAQVLILDAPTSRRAA
ncbi:MAG: ATP-binding cassette domain-containing protein, partial [Planctomycetes bacterium]|nr:ATP-binding cassette domain-containing protein [Planctomycetota bacterium]